MLITGFNLATTNYRRTQRVVFVGICVLSLLGLLLVGQIGLWASDHNKREVVAQRLGRMEGELRRHQEEVRAVLASVPEATLKRYEARVKAYNLILEASAFSWMGLLVELERSVPPGVSLGEIRPDLVTGAVNLQGVARSFEDLGLFLHGLQERTVFRDVFLLHQAERKAQAGKAEGMDFSVSLIYQGTRL